MWALRIACLIISSGSFPICNSFLTHWSWSVFSQRFKGPLYKSPELYLCAVFSCECSPLQYSISQTLVTLSSVNSEFCLLNSERLPGCLVPFPLVVVWTLSPGSDLGHSQGLSYLFSFSQNIVILCYFLSNVQNPLFHTYFCCFFCLLLDI